MKLNYGILKPGEQITFKQEAHESSYNTLKKEIDGTLDVVQLNDLDIWLDGEGLLKELKPTLIIKNAKSNKITDRDIFIVGPVVFASHNEEGDTISLTDSAAEILEKFIPAYLGENKVFIYKNY